MSTFSEERRAKLAEILGDKSVPREERIERVARFVEGELGRAFARGARQARVGGGRPPRTARGPERSEVVVEEDDL